MDFERQIFYFYVYSQGIKERNVGFAKWLCTETDCKLDIQIKGLFSAENGTYSLTTGNGDYIGSIAIQGGSGELILTGSRGTINGIVFQEITQLCMDTRDGKEVKCKIREENVPVIRPENREEEPEDISIQVHPKDPLVITSYYMSPWEQMSEDYEKIFPFKGKEACLKITPKDFYLFRNSYEKLKYNSFLLHGFYNYNYLILQKKTDPDREEYFLGVPGIYHEREIKAAKMFGFEGFAGEEEDYGQGSFGYYMITVN